MLDMSPIGDEETFKEVRNYVVDTARTIFEKDKNHSHMFFIVLPGGGLEPCLFDGLIEECRRYVTKMAKETGRKIEIDADDGQLKDVAFSYLASVIYEKKAVGYFEVGEGWSVAMDVPGEDGPEREGKFLERFRKVKEMYGGTLKNVPTRFEILFVRGRWRDKNYMVTWTIGRRDKEVWLQDFKETEAAFDKEICRASVIDKAIDKVLEEEEKVK